MRRFTPNQANENKEDNLVNESIGAADFIRAEGKDTYVSPGNTVTMLAVKQARRDQFFTRHPQVKRLLLREKRNPLVEEGHIDGAMRDHDGEHYLTYEAITLLIEKKIRQHKQKSGGLSYNTKNIFVVKNNQQTLISILTGLNLKLNEDAKLIYIEGIHSVPFYLRNENNQIHCFIVDSEAGVYDFPMPIIEAVKEVFPQAVITLSTTLLQMDYYSCSTFAIKTLMYFVKHGSEVIPYLQKSNMIMDNGIECYLLPKEKLIPPLLKMIQAKLSLSDETLSTIVSYKKNMTLRDYFNFYNLERNGRVGNSSALVKKYAYLAELDGYINYYAETQVINSLPTVSLPKRLEKIHARYSNEKSTKNKFNLHPVDLYVEIIAYCDKQTAFLSEESASLLYKIQQRAPHFLDRYTKTWDIAVNKIEEKVNKKLLYLQKILFIACHHEVIKVEDSDVFSYIHHYAVLLHHLFVDVLQAITYLKRHAQLEREQPIHDLCLFMLPSERAKWNQSFWANLAVQHGRAVAPYLGIADRIDQELTKIDPSLHNDLDLIKQIATTINYKNADKHPELAALCMKHTRREAVFEKVLKIAQAELKQFDFFPDITIHGKDLDPTLNGFSLIKLPFHDLRGFFLGEYTSCCQSVGSQGEWCAIDGMTSPWSVFYVILDKDGNIIAQTWVRMGELGEAIADSWEYVNKSQSRLFKPFFEALASHLIKYGFTRILIGQGGNTPKDIFPIINQAAKLRVGVPYQDSYIQALVLANPHTETLKKFEIYAAACQLNFERYQVLFARNTEINVVELERFITQKMMPVEDFLNIFKFAYVIGQEFLHQKNDSLFIALFVNFYQQINVILEIKNAKNASVIENALSGDEVKILDLVNTIYSPMDLPGITAKCSSSLLKYLRYSMYSNLSNEEFISIKNRQGKSLLYLACEAGTTSCIDYFLSYRFSKEFLIHLLKEEDDNKLSILHHLARHDKLSSIKKLAEYLGDNFYSLLDHQAKIDNKFQGPVIISAIYASASKVTEYLLTFYRPDLLRSMLERRQLSIDSTLLASVVEQNDPGMWAVFYRYLTKQQWQVLLESVIEYSRSVLQYAISRDAYEVALFILTHADFDFLHVTIVQNKDILNLFSKLIHYQRPGDHCLVKKIADEIISLYRDHPHKIEEFIYNRYGNIFEQLISQGELDLFADCLALLASNPPLLEDYIKRDPFFSPLHMIIRYSGEENDSEATRAEKQIPLIKILFHYCNPEQKRYLLNNTRYLSLSTINTLDFILKEVTQLSDANFLTNWLRGEVKEDMPLHEGLKNNWKPEYANAVTKRLITLYVEHFGLTETNQFLLEEKHLIRLAIKDGNLVLLQHLLPSLDYLELKKIFTCLARSNDETSLIPLRWLVERSEFPTQMLIEPFYAGVKYNHYQHLVARWPHGPIANIIWDACCKRLKKEDIEKIIKDNFLVITKSLFSYQKDTYFEIGKINAALALLHLWLGHYEKAGKKAFELISATGEDGQNAFDYACLNQNEQMIVSFFLHCNFTERQQLLEMNAIKTKNKPSTLLQKLMNQFSQLEIMMDFKSQLIPLQFATDNKKIKKLLHLVWELVAPHKLFEVKTSENGRFDAAVYSPKWDFFAARWDAIYAVLKSLYTITGHTKEKTATSAFFEKWYQLFRANDPAKQLKISLSGASSMWHKPSATDEVPKLRASATEVAKLSHRKK